MTVSISIQYARSSSSRISARFASCAGARIPALTWLSVLGMGETIARDSK